MKIDVLADPEAVARRAAGFVAAHARAGVESRGRFTLALSGGRTPWRMLRLLADECVPWEFVHIFQVDERVAPAGDPERNLTHISECLSGPLRAAALHAMPVEDSDLAAAAARYGRELADVVGTPAVLDLIHLGLGLDGHTASLVPGDPALDAADADVVPAGPYQGRFRMTLTLPLLDRARVLLWVVTGREKSSMLARLRAADQSIPAARVRRERALIIADAAAATCPASAPRPTARRKSQLPTH